MKGVQAGWRGTVERLKMEVAELKMFRFSSFVSKMGKIENEYIRGDGSD